MRIVDKHAPPRALCAAVLAAASLHALGWAWVARGGWPARQVEAARAVSSGAGAPASRQGASIQVTSVNEVAEPAPEAPIRDASLDRSGPSTEGVPDDVVDTPLMRADVQRLPSAESTGLVPTVYATPDSLQSSPHPLVGWLLDENVLDGVRQARLVLQLWVSSRGRIDRVQVLRAEPPGDWVGRALANFSDTAMAPGVQDGREVPSTVMVEIVADVERFR